MDPLPEEDLLKHLRQRGYDCDEALLSRIVANGLVRPKSVWTTRKYPPAEISAMVVELDRRKAWLPGYHNDKRDLTELGFR